MSIRFLCPFGHPLIVPDARSGKRGRCPECHQLVIVPVRDPKPSQKSKRPWSGDDEPAVPADDVLSMLGFTEDPPKKIKGSDGHPIPSAKDVAAKPKPEAPKQVKPAPATQPKPNAPATLNAAAPKPARPNAPAISAPAAVAKPAPGAGNPAAPSGKPATKLPTVGNKPAAAPAPAAANVAPKSSVADVRPQSPASKQPQSAIPGLPAAAPKPVKPLLNIDSDDDLPPTIKPGTALETKPNLGSAAAKPAQATSAPAKPGAAKLAPASSAPVSSAPANVPPAKTAPAKTSPAIAPPASSSPGKPAQASLTTAKPASAKPASANPATAAKPGSAVPAAPLPAAQAAPLTKKTIRVFEDDLDLLLDDAPPAFQKPANPQAPPASALKPAKPQTAEMVKPNKPTADAAPGKAPLKPAAPTTNKPPGGVLEVQLKPGKLPTEVSSTKPQAKALPELPAAKAAPSAKPPAPSGKEAIHAKDAPAFIQPAPKAIVPLLQPKISLGAELMATAADEETHTGVTAVAVAMPADVAAAPRKDSLSPVRAAVATASADIAKASAILPTAQHATAAVKVAAPTSSAADRQRIMTRDRIHTVYWVAVLMTAVILFAAWPAAPHINLFAAPGWARVVLLFSALQMAYVVWMVLLPDWSTVWVGMIVSAVVAAVYGMGLALVLATPAAETLMLGLTEVRRQAGGWCVAVMLLNGLMIYVCGTVSSKWRRALQKMKQPPGELAGL